MIVSLNEIESLVLKASRGAGTSWGIAEDAAQAARWLATRGIIWEPSLLRVLNQQSALCRPRLSGGDLLTSGALHLCPLHTGAAVSDLLDQHPQLIVAPVLEPVWLVPFAMRHCRGRQQIVMRLPERVVTFSTSVVGTNDIVDIQQAGAQSITIELKIAPKQLAGASAKPVVAGVTVDSGAWHELERLAAKTYVPATLQSRLAGAGAGLSDND